MKLNEPKKMNNKTINDILDNYFSNSKNKIEKEQYNFQNINVSNPMINGIINNSKVNKSYNECINKKYINIPYFNIGINEFENENQILNNNINSQNLIECNKNYKSSYQINSNKNISKLINIDKKNVYEKLSNFANNIHSEKIRNNDNVNKNNTNNHSIGVNFSINNNLNDSLNKIDILDNESNLCLINKNSDSKINHIKKNNLNRVNKKYIYMSDILLNLPPKLNYKVNKTIKNCSHLNFKIRFNEKEKDFIYDLYENDNPNEIIENIINMFNIKSEKIPSIIEVIINGIKFLKYFNSHKLDIKSSKNLNLLLNEKNNEKSFYQRSITE